jgi:hypothetical protein
MEDRVKKMVFADLYELYLKKAEKKGRTAQEVDAVICWLFGYNTAGLAAQITERADLDGFIMNAPQLNANSALITGAICGHKVEDIADPFMRKLRYMDKLIDELAKGKPLEKILRGFAQDVYHAG